MRATDLAIIIPTRDRWPVLQRTLTRLQQQTAAGAEIIVVVDGTDQVVPHLDQARVLVRPHAGPGAARNSGVRQTDRPLVLFLGDDMVPAPDLVSRHLAVHDRFGAIQTAVLGSVRWDRAAKERRLLGWIDRTGLQFDFPTGAELEAGWSRFYSCNVSLHREFFLSSGGFDPEFTYYYEDLDLGYRLGQQGLRLHFEPGAVASHLHDYTIERLRRRFEGVARGEWLMAAKHAWFEPWYDRHFRPTRQLRPSRPFWGVLPPALAAAAARSSWSRSGIEKFWLGEVVDGFYDGWDGERDHAELRDYLGATYDHERLVHHRQEVDREESQAPDEEAFFRTSTSYLYDLTAFAMSGAKTPYRVALRRLLPPGSSLLDYGCGIGSDGLRLLDEGYQVAFADYANPSTEFLRWRLSRRGWTAPVYDIDGHVPGGFDAVYAFDVAEHVPNVFELLGQLEARAGLVAVNLLEPYPGETHLHRELPIRAVLAHAERRGLVHYRVHHGRSHLVIYRSGARAGTATLGSVVQRRLGPRLPA